MVTAFMRSSDQTDLMNWGAVNEAYRLSLDRTPATSIALPTHLGQAESLPYLAHVFRMT